MKGFDWTKLKENVWLHLAILFFVAFIFNGKTVPFSNEYSYLLQLVKTYNSDFLLNDITFSTPPSERWFFNHIFGIFTLFLSIEVIGWVGRIVCWIILLWQLLRLGKRWEIPLWLISLSIFLWLCFEQSVVADEWIIGAFEAKCIAYICLLFALDKFCDKEYILPSILLGLTFSFHPLVGLWGISATILALIICRWDFKKVFKITFIAAIFSLPGLIPLMLAKFNGASPSMETLKFLELVVFPYHFDSFDWARSNILLLGFFLTFCLFVVFQNKTDEKLKFLNSFLAVLGLFFAIGIVLRFFERFDLLEFMPTRLFPVFALLFFFFALSKAFQDKLYKNPVFIIIFAGILFLFVWTNPLFRTVDQVKRTYGAWNKELDDTAKSFIWLKENTPNGTIVIAPPWRCDFWYLSERAEVISYCQPTYTNLEEWKKRLDELLGESKPENGIRENEELEAYYNKLSKKQIDKIAEKYDANYFVSEKDYSYKIAFRSGNVKVYNLGK